MKTKVAVLVMCDDAEELAEALETLGSDFELATVEAPKPKKKSKKPVVEDLDDDDDEDDFDSDLDDEDDDAEDLPTPTGAELKASLLEVQDEFDKDTLRKMLKTHGATNLKTLEKDEWPAIWAEAKNLLGGGEPADESDPDEFEEAEFEEDEAETIDVEALKASVQAFNKKHGKEKTNKLLNKVGLNTVRGIKAAKPAAQAELLKLIKKHMKK